MAAMEKPVWHPDAILTVAEVAAELRCSKAHVHHAINGKVAGTSPLPAIYMGRRRLIRRSALERWKRMNERGGISETGISDDNFRSDAHGDIIESPKIDAVGPLRGEPQ
jgi:excisionase family DNA binding protein